MPKGGIKEYSVAEKMNGEVDKMYDNIIKHKTGGSREKGKSKMNKKKISPLLELEAANCLLMPVFPQEVPQHYSLPSCSLQCLRELKDKQPPKQLQSPILHP